MRFIRSVVAVLMFAAMVVVSQASVASASAPVYTGTPPTVDGYLDPLYASSFSTIDYTQTGTSPNKIDGQIAVIETADAYYIGFQQGLTFQSNAYCANTATCYRQFGELVGSDHISFEWSNLGGKPVEIGVDILTADASAVYGYSGQVQTTSHTLGEGDTPLGCANPDQGLTGFSGMDFNWHHAGGTGYGAEPVATSSSPNYAGLTGTYPDYEYASTAEVRIDKAACQIAGGLDLAGTVHVVAHNSPASPYSANPPEYLVCAVNNPTSGVLGVESILNLAVIKFDANLNPIPDTGKAVLVSVASGQGSITSVNGNPGATSGVSSTPGGMVAVGVTSSTAGVTQVRGVLDLNGNGVWDPATEPYTNPPCPIEFSGTPPDMKITKSANVASVNAPGSITYTMTARNAGGSPATGVVVSDDLDNDLIINSATWQVGGGGASGNCTFTAGNVLSCAVGSLAPDDNAAGGPDTATISVTVTAPPAACPKVTNQAHVTATNEASGQQTDTQASPTEDNWSLPVDVLVNCGPPGITVDLIKTNNADGDASFTKSEIAPSQGATVPFHLEIRNTSTVPITITGLTDTWAGHAIDDLAARCPNVVGQTLAPYNPGTGTPILTCNFSETGYAPAPGATAKVNTAHVSAVNPADANQTAFDEDTSAVTVNPIIPTPITVDLIKTNDADGVGGFTKSEIAPSQGATVPFHLEIRNTSTVPITITGLTDTWPGHGIDNLAARCAGVVGQTLAPYVAANSGPILTCNFSETGYAPAPGAAAKVNTAHVDAVNATDPSQTAFDEDTSAVTVVPVNPPVITIDLVKTNDADGNATYTDLEMAPAQGATVPFQAVIHNTSSVAVRIDTLTDAVLGLPSLHPICGGLIGTTLAPDGQAGDSTTCLWTETAYAPAPAAGAKINLAAVTVSQVGDPNNTAADQDTSAVLSPAVGISVDLVKTNDANRDGVFTDSEMAPTEGADVPFRAVITNTSNVAVQLLSLTDEFPGHNASGICANLVNAATVLQPNGQNGDSAVCEWTEPAYSWAPNLGAKLNVARVTVGEVGNLANTAEADDSSAVTSPPTQISVTLVKTNDADRDGVYHDSEVAASQGVDVPFKAVFTNTSNVAVRIDQLTDLLPGHLVADNICGNLIGTTLQPGASATCTWTEPGYSGAPGAGSKVNVAAVLVSEVGHPNNTATAQDPSVVTTTPTAISVTLVKDNDADGDGVYHDSEVAPTEGADVPFRAVFTNTSNVAVRIDQLTDLLPGSTVADNICGNLIGTTLQPGASATCTWTEPDYSGAAGAGAKVNTAAVRVSEVGHPNNTATAQDPSVVNTAPSAISVTLVKDNDADRDATYHDAEVAPTEGADVPFRAVITNTSNVAVRIDQLTDLLPGSTVADNICASLIGTILQPGDTATCTWTEPGYAGAPDASAKVNTAKVKVSQVGHPDKTATDDDTSSVTTAPPQISVTLVKDNDADRDGAYHDSEVAPAEGADVPFRVVITNTSNVAVRIDQLTDLLPGSLVADDVCATLIGTILQPGDTATCTWTEPGYAGAPDASAKVNTAKVKVSQVGHPDKTATDDDTSSVTTTTAPPPVISITVVKTNDANGDGLYSDDETGTAGASAPFRAVITNTSSVAVVIDSVTDVWPGTTAINECASLIGTTLQPGQSVTCDFTVANYVPAAVDGAKVDTVTVRVHEAGNPNNTTSSNDVSTVRGVAVLPTVLGETVTRAPSLPRTGSDSNLGLGLGFGLIGIGSMLVLVAYGSRRMPYAAAGTPVAYNMHPPLIERNVNGTARPRPTSRALRR